MKTQLKLLVFAMAFISILFQTSKISAQYWGPFIGPGRWELQTSALPQFIYLNTGTSAFLPGASTLPGVGINFAIPKAPNYMLDIFSNLGVGDGVNVADGGANSVGYSIGGTGSVASGGTPQMFAWHSGDPSSCYFGIQSGFSTPVASTAGTSFYNTFVGDQADMAFNGTGAIWNTAVGYQALTNNTGGVAGPNYYGCKNVAVGDFALQTMQSTLAVLGVGNSNTAVGWASLQLFNPNRYSNCYANTALGSMALNRTDTGTRNTATGYQAEYKNREGTDNVAAGHQALWTDSVGVANVAVGSMALYNNMTSDNVGVGYWALYNTTTGTNNTGTGYKVMFDNTKGVGNTADGNESTYSNVSGDSNSAVGSSSLWTMTSGNGNSALGNRAGFSVTKDFDNLFLGISADKNAAVPISNATAIGAQALTSATNQMELGNDNVTVTVGCSGVAQTNPLPGIIGVTNLEIATQYSTGWAPLWTDAILGPLGPNYYAGTGTSGVRLDDLTSLSTPVDPLNTNFINPITGASTYPTGALSVDQYGNIILIPIPGAGTGTGIGYCPGLAPLLGDGGYDMNTFNFYFKGNHSGALAQNDVVVGHDCGYSPLAKLDVYQRSNFPIGSPLSSIGIYVENDDLEYAGGNPTEPVIGIQSIVPNPGNLCSSVAGWFEAPGASPICRGNYAIIVPFNGGLSGFGTTIPAATVEVDGTFHNTGYSSIFDNITQTALKSVDVTPLAAGNRAIVAFANLGSVFNIGIHAKAIGPVGSLNYGVYGDANTFPATDYAGYFHGNVFTTGGSVSLTCYLMPSDSTIKTRVNNVSNAISIIKMLRPKTYYFDTNNSYHYTLDTFQHYGFIAQQIEHTVPCIERTVATPPQIDTAGNITVPASTIKGLDYEQFIPILTAGFQEQMQISYDDSVKQKQTIDSLRAGLRSVTASHDSLRTLVLGYIACLNTLCNSHSQVHHHGNGNPDDSNTTTTNIQEVTLSAVAGVPLLYQNAPNPFSTGTKINYYLPEGTQGATMAFYDSYGNQMKVIQLSQIGNGTLNITPDNLTSGIYSYSLIVNGKIIDTKRMLLQK